MNATDIPATHPVQFEVPRPDHQSRLLLLVRWLLAIPHLVIAYLLGYVAALLTIIAWFAILFTGKYPEGMFNFVVGIERWRYNVIAYLLMLQDEYPPFSMDAGQYPLAFDVRYPERLSRWMIFIKWLLVIPNLIILFVLLICAYFTTIIAWLAILITGAYPEGLHRFAVGVLRWAARQNAYVSLMTDVYPPFSLK